MGKVGGMNRKVAGESRHWLLCVWLNQSLAPGEESPRKQSGSGVPGHVLHRVGWGDWGSRGWDPRILLQASQSSFWRVGLSESPRPLCKGNLPPLGTQISVFLCGSFQNVRGVADYSGKGGRRHTKYVFIVDDPPLDLLAAPSFGGEVTVWTAETQLACCHLESPCMSLSETLNDQRRLGMPRWLPSKLH